MQKQKASSMTLMELDDDCLECIFKRLPLPSQIKTARTCLRFRDILWRLWQRNRMYHSLCLEAWRELLTQEEDLQFFLQAMSSHLTCVRVLDCLNAFISDLNDLDVKKLPSVERFALEEFIECCPSDVDILSLSILVPQLKYMRITRPISGQHLEKFKELEELHLYEDQMKHEIQNNYLQAICIELKHLRVLDVRAYDMSRLQFIDCIDYCQTLEELKLNLRTLKPILKQVLNLPRLKRLTIRLDWPFDVDSMLKADTEEYKIDEIVALFEILNSQCERIIGLAVDNYYLALASHWNEIIPVLRYGKLRLLALCSFDTADAEELLSQYAPNMPQLRTICLRDWPLLTDAAILQFVKECPLLQHIDVSYSGGLTKKLLYDILKIIKEREEPLSMCIYVLHCNALLEELEEKSKFWSDQKEFITFSGQVSDLEPGLSVIQRGYEFQFE